MKVKKQKLILVMLLNIMLIVACKEKEEVSSNIQTLEGEIFGVYWDEEKYTKSDFYIDDSNDTILIKNGDFFRPPKNLKIDIIEKSKFNGKSVLQTVNEIKSNNRIIHQAIYYYSNADTLRFYGFLLVIEVPHYLDMVDILFYFDEEFILGEKEKYFRHEVISDSSEIKRISNILANEYKYEILQRTFISSKD